jgi:nucleoside-diphosphate-sugar epimerase
MRILVTGITGFIGQKLLPRLKEKHEIFAVCLPSTGGHLSCASVIESDLNAPLELFDKLRVIRPDACVHLAWTGIPDYEFENSRRNLNQTAVLWRHLVEECGCRKLISAGSCWEYGKSFGPCHENDSVASDSYFVWAKHALSDLGMMLAAKHGISFIWPRIFFVYGPGQRSGSLIPTLVEALRKGAQPEIKTPHSANDFIHVDDVADGLALALLKEIPTGIYNFGFGQSTPVWKACAIVEKSLGFDAKFAAKLRCSKVHAAANFWADTAKTASILGWRARIGIDQGINEYVKSMEVKA